MPRSSVNWASRQRQRFIEDALITHGHINRTMLSDYFGVEKSTGSMDIAAYIASGGPIRRALRHETPVPLKEAVERGIGAGRPIGSKGYYVHTGGAFITGSSEARREAWGLLPHGVAGGGHRGWIAVVVGAYIADHERNAMPVDYFGISHSEAFSAPVQTPNAERARVWELFR